MSTEHPLDRFIAAERALHDEGCTYPDADCTCGTEERP